ncbi:MAG: type I-U CRISPR-associated protein Csx17 [Alphaproteobacteria bacterium]|nr:type I-U CRISPR-associated protein Csx17 [Alphaproteobacteria bacterium]
MTGEVHLNDLCLGGCKPTPLASYLKALGILHLVAEQADPNAKGWWRAERFWIRTKLTLEQLIAFFLDEYAPSPIIAPWNGGSGFYKKDNQTGIKAIEEAQAQRFQALKSAIEFGRQFVRETGNKERPKDEEKQAFIAEIRATAPDKLTEWIDAAVAVTTEKLAFPPLLGTGGNDGRLDFTNNFFQRLSELIDCASGRSTESSSLRSSLFGDPATSAQDSPIGQFAPADAGGANSTSGFDRGGALNPWDFIFMMEGALLIAGGVVRRFESQDRSAASFPFTVRATAAGAGAASQAEESESRGEFWAPLWSAPSGFAEIQQMFREGRIAQGARSLRDGMDAALAIASVGADKRINAFQRYGFEKRQGKAFLATPLGRRTVVRTPRAELTTDLDSDRWFEKVRRAGRDSNAPARLASAVRTLEDSLFALAGGGDARQAAQDIIVAVGRLSRICATNNKLREELRPPPLLRRDWIGACGDEAEVRLASALAGLRLHHGADNEEEKVAQSADDYPFRAHIAPIADAKQNRRPAWTESGSSPDMVWTEGRLVDSMVAIALRRTVEADRQRAGGAMFSGSFGRLARLGDVAAFLAGEVDERRIADLALGFAWIGPNRRPNHSTADQDRPPPFAYAALKPFFAPPANKPKSEALKQRSTRARVEFPSSVVHLLATGRLKDALDTAIRRARADNLPTPFKGAHVAGVDPRRLLAALMFPISEPALIACQDRAFPSDDADNNHDERTYDDAA